MHQFPCLIFYIFHDSNISLLSFSYADKILFNWAIICWNTNQHLVSKVQKDNIKVKYTYMDLNQKSKVHGNFKNHPWFVWLFFIGWRKKTGLRRIECVHPSPHSIGQGNFWMVWQVRGSQLLWRSIMNQYKKRGSGNLGVNIWIENRINSTYKKILFFFLTQ